MGELQAGEALVHGEAGQPGEEYTAAGGDDVVVVLQTAQAVHRLDDKALVALVGHQQVTAVAHIEGVDVVLQGGAHRLLGILLGPG